jgi:hypothetical protein
MNNNELKPIKPLSLMTEDELTLYRENQRLSETLRWDSDIMGKLNEKIEGLEMELDLVRKSTLYNFSVYMQTNIDWMSKVGTFILGCVASPTVIYIVQKVLGS